MNRSILIILLILGLWLAVLSGVNATPLTGITYTIPSLTISSGGSNNLEGATYKLIDIKGQAVIGHLTGGAYDLGLGGIYGEVAATEEVIPYIPTTLSDNGLIRGTVIERIADAPGSGIRIKFRSRDAGINRANIFKLTGIATSYTTTTDDWTQVASDVTIVSPGTDTETIWDDPDITVGDSKNAYYRVVPSTVIDKRLIFGADSSGVPYNERTVGKVDILIQRNAEGGGIKYNTFSVNLLPQSGYTLDLVFPPYSFVSVDPDRNKLDADMIREWDGAGWISYFKSSTGNSWRLASDAETAGDYSFNRGYMLRLQSASTTIPRYFYVSTVGQVLPIEYLSNADYGVPPIGLLGGPLKYTAFGNPFPKNSSFNDAFATNITADELTKLISRNKLEADQIRYWDAYTNGWNSCYLAGDSTWKMTGDDASAYSLMLGTGYMFRKADASTKGAFIWRY